jgi:serine/threonine protein phosphatase PrpC
VPGDPPVVPAPAPAPVDGAAGEVQAEGDEAEVVTVPPEHVDPCPPDAGAFEPYVIGDDRQAKKIMPVLDEDRPHVHDTIVDGVSVKDGTGVVRLVVRAASVRGLAHRHKAIVRQDDYAISVSYDRRHLLAAVADGVSNSPRSHIAANVATRRGVERLRVLLDAGSVDDVDWGQLLVDLAEDIREQVARREIEGIDASSDMTAISAHAAATVIFAVVAIEPEEFGGHAATVVKIGDTSGWILRAEGWWTALGDVKNEGAAIAESATAALPLVPSTPPPVEKVLVRSGSALVLMTDGVGDTLGNGNSDVGAALAHLWSSPPAPLAFAAQVDFARPTFDDDRTVVAIWMGKG